MTEQRILSRQNLGPLFERLAADGRRILAPVRHGDRVGFERVTRPDEVALDYVQTRTSAKSAVFPPYEPLLQFALQGKDVQVAEPAPDAAPTVLFGVHPCDAASFATLEAVFTWDTPDLPFESKRANLTIIGLSCTQGDAYCFCTSVGGGPGDPRGSDILLTPIGATHFLAEILTERGQAVARLAGELLEPHRGNGKDAALAQIPPRFDARQLGAKLPALFNHPAAWQEQALRCLGCGACAFVCPTCSCFDITDERDRYHGVRLRCWDSCGLALFTLHASGHNPRTKQSERWRQRVMHKFAYQPERLGVLGCVGCGRCSRACPVDMNLAQHAQQLAETAV